MPYKSISIIGWKWIMWRMYSKFFRDDWFKVFISDIWTKLSNKEVARKWDLILISVPIDKTLEIIKEITPEVRKDSCIFDITSIKSKPIEQMLKTNAKDVVWIHPMHWSSLPIKWQTYIFCKWRGTKWFNFLKKFFKIKWAVIQETDAVSHDKIMSVVQRLSHFTDIVFAKTLEKLDVNLNDCLKLQSPVYKLKFSMMWRILAQNANLYWSIMIQNQDHSNVLKTYLDSANELFDINKTSDLVAFEKYFNESKAFLWTYADHALKESDEIIKTFYK